MSYRIKKTDERTIEAARSLLWQLVRSPLVSADDLIPLGETLKIFETVPEVSTSQKIEIQLSGPPRRYEAREVLPWWAVRVEGTAISIACGVRHGLSGDGDGELGFHWLIRPGCESESHGVYAELGMYNEDIGFSAQVRRLNLEEAGYHLRITRSASEANHDIRQLLPVTATNDSDAAIARHADLFRAAIDPQYHFNPPHKCDLCGAELAPRKYFVDGQVGTSTEWREMCSDCFLARKGRIVWGKGQLYERQADSRWLLVGGLAP